MALNPEQIAVALEAGQPDLKVLFDREGVEGAIQAKFFSAGVVSLRQFAALVKDTAELKELLKDEFAVPGDTLQSKALQSRVVVAWETAKSRSTKLAEMEGECNVRGEPKPLQATDYMAMRSAFEAKWWELEPKRLPARSYVERVLEAVEKNDLRAEPLSDVLHQDDTDEGTLVAKWDTNGVLKAVRSSSHVPLPRDPEELRMRMNILGNAWMFVGFQQRHSEYLRNFTPQVVSDYLDCLLGDHVYKLCAKDDAGAVVSHQPWSLVLSYELEIRREAFRRVYKGETLAVALRAAWRDPVVKERNFTTPLALMSKRRAVADPPRPPPAKQPRPATEAARKTGGGNKKAGKSGTRTNNPDGKCAPRTPDGKNICFAYNRRDQKCPKGTNCKFAHVCGKCYGEHPLYECSRVGGRFQ